MRLSAKQEAFCRQYTVDFNAKQAAIRAGYSPRTAEQQGSRLLRNVKVRQRIEEFNGPALAAAGAKAEKLIEELAVLGFSDLGDFLHVDEAGVHLRDWSTLPAAARRAVASVKQIPTEDGVRIEFKLHDKKGALDSLARIQGLFRDRIEVEGRPDGEALLEELRRRYPDRS